MWERRGPAMLRGELDVAAWAAAAVVGLQPAGAGAGDAAAAMGVQPAGAGMGAAVAVGMQPEGPDSEAREGEAEDDSDSGESEAESEASIVGGDVQESLGSDSDSE